MILAMIEGESDPESLAGLAKGRLKSKREELVESLEGRLDQNDRWALKELWEEMESLEEEIARYYKQPGTCRAKESNTKSEAVIILTASTASRQRTN